MSSHSSNFFGFNVKTVPVEKKDLAGFLERVKADSHLMPLEIDLDRLEVIFYQLPKSGYRNSSFLRKEFLFVPAPKAYSVDIDSLLEMQEKLFKFPSSDGSFIFHHGFGGSSYLANFLTDSGNFFALKEPVALEKTIDLRLQLEQKKRDSLLNLLMRMYLKKSSFSEKIVIKGPVNSPLVCEKIHQDYPSMKFVFLYQALEDLLVSVNLEVRKGFGEEHLRFSFANSFINQTPVLELLNEIKGKSFYYSTTLFWFLVNKQMDLLSSKTSSFHRLSTRSLYAKPEESLGELVEFLGGSISAETMNKTLKSRSLTTRHAKVPSKFYDRNKEVAAKEEKKKTMSKEIKLAKEYAESLQERFS